MKKLNFDKYGIPILSRDEIEVRTENFISLFDKECLAVPSFTPLPTICTELKEKYNVSFVFNKNLGETKEGFRFLGGYHIKSRTIFIDERVKPSEFRFNFTLAHELGHCILHSHVRMDIISGNNNQEIHDTSRDLTLDRIEGSNPRTLIEWQANRFAAALLLPRTTVPTAVIEKQKSMGITRDIGKIHLDRQSGNRNDYHELIDHLKSTYQTSEAAIKIRLKELNILIDHNDFSQYDSGPELARNVLSRVFDSLKERLP